MVEIVCDRCGRKVEGFQEPGYSGFTAGYYDTSEGSHWHKFVHSQEEEKVCDACMFVDAGFISVYGHHKPPMLGWVPKE